MDFSLTEIENQMNDILSFVINDISKIRAGGANVEILNDIKVLSYDELVPLNHVSRLYVNSNTVVIEPFEKNNKKILQEIYKSIEKNNLNLSLSLDNEDSNIIRVVFPPLTKERRKELVKIVEEKIEKGKIKIRNLRREGRELIDKNVKNGLSENLKKKYEDDLQKITDVFIGKINELLANKRKSLIEF